jgi:hypothetical protein
MQRAVVVLFHVGLAVEAHNGPTRAELATAVKRIMKFPKIGAFGLRILIRKEMLTGK